METQLVGQHHRISFPRVRRKRHTEIDLRELIRNNTRQSNDVTH